MQVPNVTIKANCKQYKNISTTQGSYCSINKNEKVVFIADKNYGWSKIRFCDDVGYVKNSCLNKSGLSQYRTATVTANAALRKSNSIKSASMKTIKFGTKVTLVYDAKYWCGVKVNGKDGFISTEKLSFKK